jgi:ABC-type glycerol-3-phosphate transport system permease component
MARLFDNRLLKIISFILLVFLAAFSLLPFLWMFSTAFKTPNEVYTSPPTWIPEYPTLGNFGYILQRGPFVLYFRNSLLVGVGTTALALLVSTLAGYGFSRFRVPGRSYLLFGFLMAQMFPSVLLIIPLFQLFKFLNLMDTLYVLILANATFAVPLCTWLIKGFFDQVPHELEEAAMIDGCSRLGALIRVVLPTSLPGIVAAGIFVFIGSWDEFVFALTFTSSDTVRTLPIGLQRFITSYEIQWNHMAAGTVLVTIPAALLFLYIQRYLTRGMLAGATRG